MSSHKRIRFDPDMEAPSFDTSAVVETVNGVDYFAGLYKRRDAESVVGIFASRGRTARVEQVRRRAF